MTASLAVTSSSVGAETAGRREGAFGGRRLLGELLVASAHHDEAAFARFYDLTSPWIYYLLRRRTGPTGHADNALRLVYIAIWRRSPSFSPQNQSALAWATTIAFDVVGS